MKKLYRIYSILIVCLGHTVYGQQTDTASYGNLVISSEPVEVRVEIPSLGINKQKTDKELIIEGIPPAMYVIRVSAKKKVLEQEIMIQPDVESHLFFNLKKKSVSLTAEYQIMRISTKNAGIEADSVYTAVREQPSFPGGENARIKFLTKNMHYPALAIKNKIEGRVFVTFIVEKDGGLSNIRVLRGIGGGCDEEAVRVIRMMPKWNPGKQDGALVRVRFNLPIKFTL